MIVSVSRRCDIPRFQFDWFMERLDAGFVDVHNPFNHKQVRRVSLVPGTMLPDGNTDGVEAFVFWTRDPRNILARAGELERRGFRFYVMVTVTGYPGSLEPNMTETSEVCASMKELAQITGPKRVIWRYDPVFLSSITGEEFHKRNFNELALKLSGSVERVIISLYDEYRPAKKRIEAMGLDTGVSYTGAMFSSMAESARKAGMEIMSCAEKTDLSPFGIRPGACIDSELINELWGLELSGRDKNQRPNCLCSKSVDIGRYGICTAGCKYCYAC